MPFLSTFLNNMKSNIEILSEIFEPTSFDCKTEMEDLQIAVTLNPDLTKILRAMELAQEQVKLCNIPHVIKSVCPACGSKYYDEDNNVKRCQDCYTIF